MDALDVVDWRRRTFAIYAEARAAADPAAAHARWAKRRHDLFATHPASPGPPAPVADYDEGWRHCCVVEPAEPERLEIATGTDGVVPFERLGRVRLGERGWLDLWALRSYGGGLWLPMRDPGRHSYGGGRYLLDTVKGADLGTTADGRLVVDLNFAYSPSCAFDPAWACPLAPPGNVLAAAVPVGELMPSARAGSST